LAEYQDTKFPSENYAFDPKVGPQEWVEMKVKEVLNKMFEVREKLEKTMTRE
jgi:hypothetical protein